MSCTIDPVFGCRLWTGKLDRDGYGFHGRTRAHIKAYVDAHGPIPDGLEVEHICRIRRCIAPHHLELVTRSQNELLKSLKYRLKRTHCKVGHPMASNRAITSEGGVTCRTCNRESLGHKAIATPAPGVPPRSGSGPSGVRCRSDEFPPKTGSR